MEQWEYPPWQHVGMCSFNGVIALLVSLTQFKVHPQKMILAHYSGPIQNGP